MQLTRATNILYQRRLIDGASFATACGEVASPDEAQNSAKLPVLLRNPSRL